jgi:hypothetical protein
MNAALDLELADPEVGAPSVGRTGHAPEIFLKWCKFSPEEQALAGKKCTKVAPELHRICTAEVKATS